MARVIESVILQLTLDLLVTGASGCRIGAGHSTLLFGELFWRGHARPRSSLSWDPLPPIDVARCSEVDAPMRWTLISGLSSWHSFHSFHTLWRSLWHFVGRRRLRLTSRPAGLQGLSAENHVMVFLVHIGNMLLAQSAEACATCASRLVPLRLNLISVSEYGAPSVKPTRRLISHQAFRALIASSLRR